MAMVITSHMPRNAAAAPGQVCPGMRIQAMAPHTSSAPSVLVMALPPDAVFVAPERRAIQPLVHAPQAIESARVGGIGVIHHAVAQHEGAHAGAIADVSRRIRAAVGCEFFDD